MDLAEQVIKYWTIFSHKWNLPHGIPTHLGGCAAAVAWIKPFTTLKRTTFCKDSLNPKNRGDLLCIWKEWSTTTRTHSFTLIQRIPGVIKYSPFSFSSLLDLYSFRCNRACASPIVSVLVNDLCVCLAAFSVKYSNWTAYSIIFFYLEEAYQRFQSLTSEVLIALKRYIRLLLLGRPYHHS